MNAFTDIAELERTFASKTPDEQKAIAAEVMRATLDMKWIPSVGPQLQAYESKADVILYGGEPGGGKTDLLLGLAFNEHQRSLIMRRRYVDLGGIIDRAQQINGGKDGYSGAPPPSIKKDKLSIEFGACQSLGDEQNWQGRARDFLGIDEATQYAELQVRFLMGWVRSVDPKQRTRVVMATNPPLTSEGTWVIKMFAPWLDKQYPYPAKPGELRWVITNSEGEDQWVEGPGAYTLTDGKVVEATSRTFIPSSVDDNPFLRDSGYKKTLDALPEPYRSLLMGGFATTFRDAPHQIIPTAWVIAAQKRWLENPRPPHGVPMCAIGVDPSGGGDDPMAIAPRYDGWYPPVTVIKGKDIPKDKLGSFAAAQTIVNRRDRAIVILDLGGGYGGACHEHLVNNGIEVSGYKGNAKSVRRTKDRQLGFFNKRSEALWRFREALDPDQPGGSPIFLPDSPTLRADLCAPCLDLSFVGIKAETKEEIVDRLGRSPNEGDAVMMAWIDGPKALYDKDAWDKVGAQKLPKVVMGRRH